MILLVEDSRLLRVMNERTLARAGYRVMTACDGEEVEPGQPRRVEAGQRIGMETADDLVSQNARLDDVPADERDKLEPAVVRTDASARLGEAIDRIQESTREAPP